MNKLFYNLNEPTAFSSHGPLQKASRASSKKVTDFLESQPVFSRHKQLRYKFPRRRTYGDFVFSHLQADLVELGEFARNNKWNRYCLTMIDCYSRYAFTIPLKNKTSKNVVEALSRTFEKINMYPSFLVTDKGKEFENREVKDYLDSRKIRLIHPETEIKCAMVERFNRTWQNRLYKYFTHSNSVKWIESGKKITEAINKSYHRIIKCTPEQVFLGKKKPADALIQAKTKKPKYKIGQMVRMSHKNKVFRKGYRQGWTEEEFQILQALEGAPPVYRIVDTNGEEITGIVYEQELVKAV